MKGKKKTKKSAGRKRGAKPAARELSSPMGWPPRLVVPPDARVSMGDQMIGGDQERTSARLWHPYQDWPEDA